MSSAPADRLETLFHAALEMPHHDRPAFLSRACNGDSALRAELEALLEADSRAQLLIDQPALMEHFRARGRVPAGALPAGQHIGSYELTRLIGSGGMGSVYEAVQAHPRRTVALKLLRASFATPDELRRFEHEVELLGRLQHPNIAQIYEAGVHEDGLVSLPYFAMERIADAQHLLEFVRARDLPLRERLTLFLKICDAVQHGHQRGVVHRDLKPTNILVDSAGEPRVIDYGVARAIDADMRGTTIRTNAAEFVGTLQYMAPEQLRADPAAIDTRCDIYALGVVLFELLTGKRPFDLSRATWTEAIRTIEQTPLPSAAASSPELRGDLATIIAKAGEKDRERRYPSVGELAEDIRRYLRSEPISARPPSLAYHARKFAGRHRTFVAAVVVSMASVVGGAGVAVWKAAEARTERAIAIQNTRRADAVRAFLERMLASGEARHLGSDVSMLEAIDRAAAEIPVTLAEDPSLFGDLNSIIGRTYVRMGHSERAAPFLKAAIDARRIASGDPSDALSTAILDLAWVSCQPADEKVRLFKEAIEMLKVVRSPTDPHVAAAISYLASVEMDECDRIADAERHIAEALGLLESTGRTRGTEYGFALMVRGAILVHRQQFTEAEKALRDALAVTREARGPRHTEVALILRRLGRLLERNGPTDESRQLLTEAAQIEPHRN